MVAGAILPYAYKDGKVYFLFGKENSMEDSAKGFSDFGGGVEGTETPFQTALREGGEELTGFLGDGKSLKKMFPKRKQMMTHNTYHTFFLNIPYDEMLPLYYNNNHRFLWERMDKTLLNKSKLFEKIEIEWFSVEDMVKRRNEFRGFYREIVDKIVATHKTILKNPKKNQTMKNRIKA